ncbi:hypothetical protein QGP82_16175 [Leptothoe sp. LEGE 181152]|nr:hypothetical protein [Leptothoe sp. LEGE 181152]
MSKPQSKALLSCLTLLTTYSSANLGYGKAAEINVDADNRSGDDVPDLTVTQQSDSEDVSGATLHAQSIQPDHEVQPAFASQSVAITGNEDISAHATIEDSRAARLQHLVDTTTRDLPSDNSLLSEDILEDISEDTASALAHSEGAIEIAVATVPAEQTPVEVPTIDVFNTDAVDRSGVEDTVVSAENVESDLDSSLEIAQLPLEPPIVTPRSQEQKVIEQLLEGAPSSADIPTPYRSSPAITISNPSGFGADNFTGFIGVGYQERTRFANQDDGGLVVGVGLGDARENIGVQLSYTVASFGGSRDFGTGGFNAKLHKRLADDWSVALGWEGFATTGFVDFEDSIYGSVSHLIRTRESITQPFSRIALTAGVGNGRFRTEDDVFDDRDSVGVFGSAAVRVAEPVSAIVEWTGQDLAVGLSITPFKDIPIVLLPAVRDIAGAGDGGRFVMGAGLSFQL